jgi:hypothetical protein
MFFAVKKKIFFFSTIFMARLGIIIKYNLLTRKIGNEVMNELNVVPELVDHGDLLHMILDLDVLVDAVLLVVTFLFSSGGGHQRKRGPADGQEAHLHQLRSRTLWKASLIYYRENFTFS